MVQVRSANPSGSWMKHAVSLIVEHIFNAKVDEQLGRMGCQQVDDQQLGASRPFTGYWRGFKSRRLKAAERRIDVDVPQVPLRSTSSTKSSCDRVLLSMNRLLSTDEIGLARCAAA